MTSARAALGVEPVVLDDLDAGFAGEVDDRRTRTGVVAGQHDDGGTVTDGLLGLADLRGASPSAFTMVKSSPSDEAGGSSNACWKKRRSSFSQRSRSPSRAGAPRCCPRRWCPAAVVSSPDLDDVEPMAHPLPLANVMRDDVVQPCLDREEVLAAAPAAEDGRFRVPPIIGLEE
jgi:hypothetical protein